MRTKKPETVSRARKKIHYLLRRHTQRELAKQLGITQPGLCQLSTGEIQNPRQSTRRKFTAVGIAPEDWED